MSAVAMITYPGFCGTEIVETFREKMNRRVTIKTVDAPSVIRPQEKGKLFAITSLSYAREVPLTTPFFDINFPQYHHY